MSRLTKKEEWKDEVGEQHHYYSSDNACLEKLGKLEDLFDSYGIETLEDLNVILAEYFCEIKDHTFKAKG